MPRLSLKKIHEADLLGKGAGHVLLKLSEKEGMEIKDAGMAIKDGKYSDKELADLFSGGVA